MGNLVLSGATSGAITLQPTDATTQTITLPANSGTVITTQSSGKVIPTAALPAGTVLKVQQFTDAGSSTTAGSLVNLNGVSFAYTPVSTSSTLFLTLTFYGYLSGSAGYPAGGVYGFYSIGEYNGSSFVAFGYPGYLWNYQYSTTYAQSIGTQLTMVNSRTNSSLSTRYFDLMGAVSNANMGFVGASMVFTVTEVAV